MTDSNDLKAASTADANMPKPAKIDGARRMGVTFNPGNDPRVDELKKKFAELHDLVDAYCTTQMTAPKVDDAIARQEIGRACSTALTHLQTAKMYAIEAITR
jgi:hypothetical protein